LGIDQHRSYEVTDLLADNRYLWSGWQNYVELNPQVLPAHVFSLRRRMNTEQNFDPFV
jgi:starch synthase (maltosyl-transferring)